MRPRFSRRKSKPAVQEMALNCPHHVALAVFDDLPGGDVFRPQLTVVSQPATILVIARRTC
jgi:DNA-binding LacI/PurR family transcriptional regulator